MVSRCRLFAYPVCNPGSFLTVPMLTKKISNLIRAVWSSGAKNKEDFLGPELESSFEIILL